MKRRRRDVAVFGLSFLDCISCGFGAAVLLFMLVDHARVDLDLTSNAELIAKVDALESEVLDNQQDLLTMQAALSRDETELQTADAEARRLREQIELLRSQVPDAADAATTRESRLRKLQEELLALESRVQAMRAASQNAGANATRSVIAEGQRQYLTGMRVGGQRVLILVDASASMLGETIVDAVRRRNMSEAAKLGAPKWRRTLATVDWITAQLPPDGQFQMLAFAESTLPVLGSSVGWLSSDGGRKLDEAMVALRRIVPKGGTNLMRAFEIARSLRPAPDNIFLITDGLPTLGKGGGRTVASGKDRVKYFNEAEDLARDGAPINIVLLPMEGDPQAASAYWYLAQLTGGAFLNPSPDWP
ncbi:MAG: vWA domain-containing protein [Panacagrimonas sp.]